MCYCQNRSLVNWRHCSNVLTNNEDTVLAKSRILSCSKDRRKARDWPKEMNEMNGRVTRCQVSDINKVSKYSENFDWRIDERINEWTRSVTSTLSSDT